MLQIPQYPRGSPPPLSRMTANCLGNFGTYQYMYHTYNGGPERRNQLTGSQGTVWVTKRYTPTDLRITAPVPRHKLIAPQAQHLPRPEEHWLPHRHQSLAGISRDHEERAVFRSQPSTRCEEYSTLRQMLPSIGRPVKARPPNWGTGYDAPPHTTSNLQRRFPHINSPMTRYVKSSVHTGLTLVRCHPASPTSAQYYFIWRWADVGRTGLTPGQCRTVWTGRILHWFLHFLFPTSS